MKLTEKLNTLFEKEKQQSAVITKNNAGGKGGLDLAFADSQDGKVKGIAITPNTKIRDDRKIASLKVGEKIAIQYKDTPRGLEATIVAFN